MLHPLVVGARPPRDAQHDQLAQTGFEHRLEQQHAVVGEERAGERGMVHQRAERVRHAASRRAGRQEAVRHGLGEPDAQRGTHVVVPRFAARSGARRGASGHRYQPPLTPMSWPVM